MADIKLVIKLQEDTYKNIIKNGFIYDEDNEVVTHAIKKGTSLPAKRSGDSEERWVRCSECDDVSTCEQAGWPNGCKFGIRAEEVGK